MTNAPHDALFKKALSKLAHARAALKSGLPAEVAGAIDFSSLTQVPGSFIDPQFTETQSDLLFSANRDGSPVLLYLLVAHKSDPDRVTPD